ncbi:MAG: AAA family ATPase [Solobacterium sp.]|nr:AAA family ATPase [Solobacterium sp.]
MTIKIPVGEESFDEIRKAGLYYVDKTELIYELVGQTGNKVTLFTRPRRFGKTLNMSMMESFFDIKRDSNVLFKGLIISKHEAFCSEWMNQYPVLFISFKDVDGLDFESANNMLKVILSDYCKKIAGLGENENTDSDDRAIFARLKAQKASAAEVQNALKTIMRMMNAVYGKPVILLIDEYDVPLAKASEKNTAQNRYYEQMLDVIKGMLSIALKTNEYLKFAVVTGCLRIAKESIFTGTNNFASYSVMDERFSKYFGFTQKEMDKLLATANLKDKTDIIREWYDGYVFGNTSVYCPWDTANYVSALVYDKTADPKNYWRNTSSNAIIRDFVDHSDWGIPDKFETILNGGTVTQEISDELTYDTLYTSEQNLWSILLMTGYLTKADPAAKGNKIALRIPNTEIAGIFEDTVVKLFTDTLDNGRQKELLAAFWNEDIEDATRQLNDFLWETISYHDYHEDYYHAFMTGLFVGLGYSVDSNKESGLGRFDIRVKDRKNRRAMIFEVKKAINKAQMEKACDEAIDQIVEKGYAATIAPGYEKIICYGIVFYQKSAMIKKV